MKKLLANLKFTFIALLATGMILITQSAFKSSQKQDSNSYYFTGNSTAEMRDFNKWSASTGTEEECTGESLPCLVIVPDGQTLEEYINNNTDSYIIRNASLRKAKN